jgi:tRNA threonylcarbamoyladenosine biosynthesis protein TsaE
MDVPLQELPAFARAFADSLPKTLGEKAYVVGLSGELGAGKTAFVQEVAKALGTGVVPKSPTFVIAQAYAINRGGVPFTHLIHIDAYRLSPESRDTIGWTAYAAEPKNLVLAEWPEHLPGGAPKDMRLLSFTVTGETTRDIVDSNAHAR